MEPINFYTQFILNPQLLANGYTLIRNYLLQSQNNRQQTLINLLISSPPIITIIGHVYPCDVFPSLPQQQKTVTRNYLIELLSKTVNQFGSKSKNCQNLMLFIKKIHNQQGYQHWILLYSKLIQSISVQEFGPLIISILQSADDRVSSLSMHLFVYVIKNYEKYNLSLNQIMQIMFYCVKSFAYMAKTQNNILQQYFLPYQKMLVQFIWSNLRSTPISMKYGLKLLTILYGDMNFSQNQDQISHNNITKLGQFGLQICQQYIKIISNSNYKSQNLQQQQIEQQNSQNKQINTTIGFIIYQLFQLYDIILSHPKYKINIQPIILTGLLAAVPSILDMIQWRKNTEQYLISLQNQYERTLRNRANDFINMLIQDHHNKVANAQIIGQYFSNVAISCQKQTQAQSLKTLQYYIQQQFNNKFQLFGQFIPYQQAAYFILGSYARILFKNQKHKELLHFMMNRYSSSCCTLIKISTIYICINQMKQPPQKQIINFILNTINTDSTIYHPHNIGIALVLGRGLGKICYSQSIIIQQHIHLQFINLLVSYLKNFTNKPDEDQTHIVLQILLKLTDCNNKNRESLQKIIDKQLQKKMINNYMYDGLLSKIVLQILQKYPYKQIIIDIFNMIMIGNITDQKCSQLIVKWIKSGHLIIDYKHIQVLLQKYQHNKRDIINPIVKFYLSNLKTTGEKPPTNSNLVFLLNSNPNQTWLVPMLQCGILSDFASKLIQIVQQITYSITSLYQLQCKLCYPYYFGIYETQKMLKILSQKNDLYKNFLTKLLKYSKLFEGQHLKIITSIFYIKVIQYDNNNKQQMILIIKNYGKLQINQWKDQFQQNQDNQQQIIQQLISNNLGNQFIQNQLYNVFNTLSQNYQFVNSQILLLSKQYQ